MGTIARIGADDNSVGSFVGGCRALVLLNLFYLGLALIGAWRWWAGSAVVLLIAYIFVANRNRPR